MWGQSTFPRLFLPVISHRFRISDKRSLQMKTAICNKPDFARCFRLQTLQHKTPYNPRLDKMVAL